MAFLKPTFASSASSTSTSNASSSAFASASTSAGPRAPPQRRVHFNESPLTYTYTPPATPIVTPPRTPPWSQDTDEEEDTDTDEGPCTPPSNAFPPAHLSISTIPPKLPSPYGGNGSAGGSSLYDSPKKSPNPSNLTPTPSPSPLLFDPSTMKSQLVWNVTTPPTTARARIRAPHNLHSRDLDPSTRARARLPRMGKGKDSHSPGSLSNANAFAPGIVDADETLSVSLSILEMQSTAATYPGLSSLEVHIPQLPPFWKPLQLQARASASKTNVTEQEKVVTIADLLNALHKYLQTPITQREFNFLPESVRKSVARAYWRRYDAAVASDAASPSGSSAGEGTSEAERIKKSGVCRVDALAGNTQFVAFVPVVSAPPSTPTTSGRCAWQVILAAPPTPTPTPMTTPAPALRR